MKNIHTLLTQNPSRLGLHQDNKLYLHDNTLTKNLPYFRPQHIYITCNEEIKERDSVILGGVLLKNIRPVEIEMYLDAKKIILTTDPELIKDGVQAIDDDFLEWFVKNPSCEEVEVKIGQGRYFDYGGNNHITNFYKIIIPKEEPKQETLEEAMESYLDSPSPRSYKGAVEFGAKWQAERMYSEEDMKSAIEKTVEQCNKMMQESYGLLEIDVDYIFEQFKKK
jgi:hypothetical protein